MLSGEEIGHEVAERGDDLRLDEHDRLEQVSFAGLDLIGHGVAGCQASGFTGAELVQVAWSGQDGVPEADPRTDADLAEGS